MGQNNEIKAQNTPLPLSTILQQETSEMMLHAEEKLTGIWEDIFRDEAFQYYISKKREPATPISMTVRFSSLLWLVLGLLLLSLVILGILLDVLAGIPVFG